MKIKTEGFYRLYRDVQSIDWLNNDSKPFRRSEAWIFLLLNTEYKDSTRKGRFHDVQIHNGEIFIRESELADTWHWSKSSVHTFLQNLIKEGMIKKVSKEKDNKNGSVYKIINYEKNEESKNKEERIQKKNEQSTDIAPEIKHDFSLICGRVYEAVRKSNRIVQKENFQSIEPLLELVNSGTFLPSIDCLIDWIESKISNWNTICFWTNKINGISDFCRFHNSMLEQFCNDFKAFEVIDRNYSEYYQRYSSEMLLYIISQYDKEIDSSSDYLKIISYEREIKMCEDVLKMRNKKNPNI